MSNGVTIALEARCSAVTQAGRYCLLEPVGEAPAWMRLPSFIQLCRRHVTAATEHRNRVAETEAEERRAEERRLAREATVYYVQRADQLIKIGYTARLGNRLTQLRREHGPLDVLATHLGGKDAEQAMHRTFNTDRVTGEWFRPSVELVGHVRRIRARRERDAEPPQRTIKDVVCNPNGSLKTSVLSRMTGVPVHIIERMESEAHS